MHPKWGGRGEKALILPAGKMLLSLACFTKGENAVRVDLSVCVQKSHSSWASCKSKLVPRLLVTEKGGNGGAEPQWQLLLKCASIYLPFVSTLPSLTF